MQIQKFTHREFLEMPLAVQHSGTQEDVACVRSVHALSMREREDARFGIWEASIGKFTRNIPSGEVMHILAGQASFTDEAGHVVDMRPGDTLVFPPNIHGTWVITERFRKLYILI